jgi:Trk K+ transport system NAD-binding subunit/Kef-type K+ transport system membrane component KefB/mannitol/fructose-specific phosphotransferase system IIA component (Ntr-type)
VDNPLITFSFVAGFIIVALASRQIGTWFAQLRLPLITGYLFAGIVVGPYVLKIIPPDALGTLKFIDEISLAYIAFAAGSELVVRQIKGRLKAIRWTTGGLVLSTYCCGTLAFLLISDRIPFVQDMPWAQRAAVALLAGAILVARSPSSAIAVVNELRARGPFTKTALGVTVIMDVVVITLFSISASAAETILADDLFDGRFMVILLTELTLALALGCLLSYLLRFILSRNSHRSLKILLILTAGLGVFIFSSALRRFTHDVLAFEVFVEPMLICMLAGFLTANYSVYRTELIKVLHDIGPPVYIVFFTLTGVSLQLDVLSRCWVIALALFAVRLGAVFAGTFSAVILAGEPMKYNKIAWMCYITQAGVGLGLAKEVAGEFPQWGAAFATLVIAVIVLNQLVGPPLFKWALNFAGEARPPVDNTSYDGGIRDVVIFGLGGESLALARLLQSNGWEVKIATTQVQYARAMAPDADVEIHPIPDLSLQTLNKLGIGHADSIVAMLSDEENLNICEVVNENIAPRNCIVRLNHRTNFKRFHDLGALVVEPNTAIVNLLDQFVRSPSAARLLLGMEPGREIIEFEMRNPDLQGAAVRDLQLPLDLHILSLRRSGQMIVFTGFTRLKRGDWLTVVGSPRSLEAMMLRFGENREYELVHMVGRATSKKLASRSLDKEVKAILHGGDDQRRSTFERIVEESIVLDLPSSLTVDHFFKQVAESLSVWVDASVESLFQLLMEREKESSTALRPDLAIPHIIIDGENTFRLLLARCREGIYFSELAPRVQAVFVLAGTRDLRDFHLYVLSAVAEMVQAGYFQERWLNAKNETTLRNIAKAHKHA